MGKLAGTRESLTDFREVFSLQREGRVFSLKEALVTQQRVNTDGRLLLVGGTMTTDIGTVSSISFEPGAASPSGMLAMGFTSANTRLSFDNTKIGDLLGFTTKELTISMWISGSTVAPTVLALSESCRLRSSGTYGVQFSLGASDVTSPAGNQALYAVAVLSDGNANVVATTGKTVDSSGYELGGEAYVGRYKEVTNPFNPKSQRTAVNVLSEGWHHVVYVQRAAEDPTPLEYNAQFGQPTSQKYLLSDSGKEGRCEMWLDGELVYASLPQGPFPRGFSPYFYESGIEGLNGSTEPQHAEGLIKKRALRQPSPIATVSGSSTNGDAIAQLAVWQRCLSNDEIFAIYAGTKNGIFKQQTTSESLLPKRLIDPSGEIYEPALNDGYPDSNLGTVQSPFTDSMPPNSDIYQENFFLENMNPSIFLNDTTERKGVTKFPVSSFNDREDFTSYVEDPELVIPSGSSEIRIPLPNESLDAIACRYQYTGGETLSTVLGSATKAVAGTGFLYYSPLKRTWVEKRPDSSTSQFPINSITLNDYSASNYLEQGSEYVSFTIDSTPGDEVENNSLMLSNRVLSQFAWSPQFGYFVHHTEHLQQVGYERIGWPTSMFSAPNAPKYHGYDSETLKMRDYITRPFLLKKAILRVNVESERRFGSDPTGPSGKSWNSTTRNKKDIDNYVFFLYRQRRLSRNKDSFDDRTTSKRYLIASASVCYYNSGSFGGAWADGYYTDALSPWSAPDPQRTSLYNGVAKPNDSVDFFGQSLTKFTGSNMILHGPQLSINWEKPRNATTDLAKDSRRLELEMYPTVVPACSVAPSLMPVTGGGFSTDYADTRFAFREGGPVPASGSTLLRCYQYRTSGTRDFPDQNTPAPYLTLLSNFWFGGSRPPTISSFTNQSWTTVGSNIVDAYDSVGSPGQVNARGSNPLPGQVDVAMQMTPTYTSGVVYYEDLSVFDSATRYIPIRGPVQAHGVSFIPSFSTSGSSAETFDVRNLRCQQPLDPQSVNSPSPGSQYSQPKFYGRKTYNDAGANGWGTEHRDKYMGYYGWRFISSFHVSDFTERQVYSPVLLDPDDELIIGLDAGTFGPPDLEPDSLIADGLGPTEGLAHGTGLTWNQLSRSDKETFLKEDYSTTLADSRLRIRTGEAEIILIGDFLQDGKPIVPTRDTPVSSNVTQGYGTEPIGDQYLLYNADLLSGSLFTRVFTGSAGVSGLLEGNSDESKARRYYYDAGARKTY
jgi:hypothetical protein